MLLIYRPDSRERAPVQASLPKVRSLSFDPNSRGARRLTRDWWPHLERWEVRVQAGHFFIEDDGGVVGPGETMEVPAPHGRQLIERGSAALVSTRRMRAWD